jgi:hypothetical protein
VALGNAVFPGMIKVMLPVRRPFGAQVDQRNFRTLAWP